MNQYQRTRRDHAQERSEDYLELVEALIEETGRARVTDLADRLRVRSATVTQMVRRLTEEGLVEWSPYQAILLTQKGRERAEASRARHKVVLAFLVALGVPAEAASHDSEGIEHHVSAETLQAMQRFLADRASARSSPSE